MWDVLDEPPGDDDTITSRGLNSVVSVFRSYPRPCVPPFDNGCNSEGYPYYQLYEDYAGNNWKDYKRSHVALFPGDAAGMTGIENRNHLDLQDGG
jgi:hypothetical protein